MVVIEHSDHWGLNVQCHRDPVDETFPESLEAKRHSTTAAEQIHNVQWPFGNERQQRRLPQLDWQFQRRLCIGFFGYWGRLLSFP